MEAHCSPGDFHPEQPLRITAIFSALADQGLAQKCWRVPARNATQAELVTVHTAQHVQNICNLASKSQGDLNDMAAKLDSVYLCPESGNAALLASGSVIEATRLVCQGKIARACCVVRPPGHHALPSPFFKNSVAKGCGRMLLVGSGREEVRRSEHILGQPTLVLDLRYYSIVQE